MIPYGRQSIIDEDIDAVVSALKGKFLTTGPLVDEFETLIARVVGAPTVCVSSGTAALHCAYAAIDLKPGDEVITPPITFIATQATAALFGAKIVFVDVQHDTGNIDPSAVEAAITSRTKAIVAVDYAGHPAELDELKKITKKHNLYLIEDAAHSMGSMYKGRPVGSIADLTTFSFFPTKNLTTAEGGAVSSPNPELLLKAKRFARQGLVRNKSEFKLDYEGPWHQEVHNFGLNYRLPDVLCALGISQISRLEKFKAKRRLIMDFYSQSLSQINDIKLPVERKYVNSNWHLVPIKVHQNQRLELFKHLHKNNVGVQVNYLPAHLHPVFENLGHKRGEFPAAEHFYDSEISLPIFYDLDLNAVSSICEIIKNFFE